MKLNDVLQALRNADAAGDTAAATRLAQIADGLMKRPEDRIPIDYTLGETLTRGVSRGTKRLGSTFGDVLPAMVASGLGFDAYAKRQMEEAAQTEREIYDTNRPQFESYKQVQGPMDALKFGIETVAEQGPNIATSLIPGLGAAGLATRAGLGVAGRAAAVGAGTFLGSYAQNAPEVFQNIYEETGKMEPGAAALFGVASAALDSILPASLAKNLSGPVKAGIVEKILEKSGMERGLLRSVTAGMVKGIPAEGLTEGAQEAISIAAERFIAENPKVFGSKEWDRIMESAVRGAVAGGAFAGAGGAAEAGRAGAERREAYAQALERRGQRQLAAQVRNESIAIEELDALKDQLELPGFETGPYMGILPPKEKEPKAPKAPKELKGKQLEMFGDEGELTPALDKQATRDQKATDKAEANRARQEAQRQAAEVKEAQARLKKYLAAKQQTLPGFDEQSVKALQQQAAAQQQAAQETGQGDLFGGMPAAPQVSATQNKLSESSPLAQTSLVEGPKVRTTPTLETITKIEDPKAFGKLFGIGPTARILRADGPLAGKDLSNPADAAEVKTVLEAYASGKPATGAAEKIDAYLKRPEFQTQGAPDVAGPVEQPTGASVPVADQPSGTGPAAAAEGVDGSGMVSPTEVVGEPAAREGEQPGALKRGAEVVFKGNRGIVGNESVLGGLRRISEDDDIATPTRVGAVLLTGLERQAGGQPGRATEVLRTLTGWADTNNERLVLSPAASGDLKQDDLVKWYERNGFTRMPDGVMEREPRGAADPAAVAAADIAAEEAPTIKRAPDFRESGEYEVTKDGQTVRIYRDPESGYWYSADGKGHYTKNFLGYNKAEAVANAHGNAGAPAATTQPEAGKKAKKDQAKAEAGAQQAAQEQAQFVQEVDQNTNDILVSRLREVTRAMGLDDNEVPADDYRGTDAHNQLRLAQLMAQYRDSESMLRESVGTPQEAKNQQQLADIEKEIAASGPDALEFFNQLRQLPTTQQVGVLSHLNRQALTDFSNEVQSRYAAQAREREARRAEDQPTRKVEGRALQETKAQLARNRIIKAAQMVLNALKSPAAKRAFAEDFAKRGLEAINDAIARMPAKLGNAVREDVAFLYGDLMDVAPSNPKAKRNNEGATDATIKREVSNLSEKEVDALELEYNAPRNSEPFLSRLKEDIATVITEGIDAVSKSIRKAVQKIAEGVLSVALIFNPNVTLPNFSFDLPKAYAQTATQTVEIRDQVPAEALAKMSLLAREVYESMAPTAKKSGKGFIIADKPNGVIHFFTPDGRVLVQDAALFGKDAGDTLSGTKKITPAGQYTLRPANDSEYAGGKVLHLAETQDETGIVAVHAAYLGDPKENRKKRLETPSAADNKVSWGCINTSHEVFLDKVLPKIDMFNGGMIFVLPDAQENTSKLFPSQYETTTTTFTGYEQNAQGQRGPRDSMGREEQVATRQEAAQQGSTKLFLPAYEGPAFNAGDAQLAQVGDLKGLVRSMLGQIKDPAIAKVLRKIQSLNLKTKIVVGDPQGSMALPVFYTDTLLGKENVPGQPQYGRELRNPVTLTNGIRLDGFSDAAQTTFTGYDENGNRVTVRREAVSPDDISYSRDSNKTAEALANALRKLYAESKAGSYDPATDTITLDPRYGLNAHTFIHELVHAAISNVLASPNHPLTKDFAKFFGQIQDRMGAAYGAQDLQEFAAELVGNPSFQAVLKSIKTPRSENLFRRILRSVAEFFGFAPKTSAFDTGLDFIEKALDITSGVEATAAQKMFQGMGNFPAIADIGRAMPALTRQATENAKNVFSNLTDGGGFKAAAFGVLRLDNLRDIYNKQLPAIQKLLDALELRTGIQERRIKDANEKYKRFVKVQRKHPEAMKRLNDIAIDARLEEVDLLNPKFQPTAQNMAAYTRLSQAFRALPEEVQNVYRTIRGDYDGAFAQYRKILMDAAEQASPSLAKRLAEQFQIQKPVVGYIPFTRSGNFWVEYTDPKTGEPAVHAFESFRERQQFIEQMLKGQPHRTYNNIEDARFSGEQLPPTHFIMQVVNQLRSQGASQAQLDGVYQAYLSTFPAESLMKQFMKSKNRAGMERDIVKGYGDLMVRWARKLSNSEYVPQIDRAMREVQNQAQASGDPTLTAVAQNITDQAAFFHNPNFNTFVHTATALSYFEYIAGNISSALINLTSLPMLVYPLLTGRFGWGDTMAAMKDAGRTAMNDWGKSGKYKNLYETLMDHAQLEHTMAREVMEGRRQNTNDFVGLKARILDGLSIPFIATEKYNRAVTAIAAYDLARKTMNEQDAIRYALNTVKDVHTSGMAATGPKWMQTPLGRLFFTFKSFVWNSAYIMARAFHQAFKGENAKVREAAQRQLLATYGMATVFTGIKGMPFYGAVSVLANMINALFGDDEEPFDFDEFLRDIFPEFLYKGAFNYVTNIEIANRAGIATDLIFRDDPRGVAEHGYVLSALQQAFGPIGSIAVNSGRAAELFGQGEIERSIETIAPSFLRNAMKGTRYLLEGATTIKGDPVMEDISAYNSLMQMIGFSPADLSSQYERMQAAKGFEREVNKRRSALLTQYDMAVTSGDSDLLGTVLEKIEAFNDARPSKRITKETLDRSIRARAAAEKDMINGVRFDKNLLPEIRDKFFEDDED